MAITNNAMFQALLIAMEGNDEARSAQLHARAVWGLEELGDPSARVNLAHWSAELHYFQGNYQRALETMPEISPPSEGIISDLPQMSQVYRLEQLRARARVLIALGTPGRVEEGHHLVEVFRREVILLPRGPIRSRLTPD